MNRGFTLVEVLVVVGITTTVGLALLSMITYFYRSNAYLLEATSASGSASRGVSESIAMLREASYGEDGNYPLLSAATSSITFYSDTDADKSIERVRLFIANRTLYRGITEATGNPASYAGQPETITTITEWISNTPTTPAFRYFTESGSETVTPVDLAAVRTVRARFDVDINPLRAPNIVTIEGSATLRNLRDQ
ncbi:MAG TPA: prepilin-type N-terminal cleavage/methylation domain-containing protein [Candidatus Paceibacterota bacterium]|nr:prepilin-type N-terminal cleavage/methylation domain-containing protein [Candidatus Paceibacterota bacterium]